MARLLIERSFDKSRNSPSLLPAAAREMRHASSPISMTASEDKLTPGKWIPWFLALSVWFGWNAVAPDHLAAAKKSSGEEIGLAHQSDDLPAPVVHPRIHAELAPLASVGSGLRGLPSQRLGIEVLRELPAEDPRWGGIQGRAPPSEA